MKTFAITLALVLALAGGVAALSAPPELSEVGTMTIFFIG
jgi:hypothetical protein